MPLNETDLTAKPMAPVSNRRRRLLLWLRWLPVLLPPLVVAFLIHCWQVNSWLSDDWMLADLMEKASQGTLSVGDFTAVQMEHRLVLPRLIAVPALLWTHGDLRILNWIAWALQTAALAAMVLLLVRGGRGKNKRGLPLAAFLISLALFSTIQWQSFLWPICFTIQLPLALLALGTLALAVRRWHPWLRLGLAWLAAAGGALSFASGLPTLFTLPAAVACGLGGLSARQRKLFCVVWALLTIGFFTLYFQDFRNKADPDHSFKQGETITLGHHLSAFISEPGKSARFILTALGAPLARGLYADPRDTAPIIGGLLVAFAAWMTWVLLRTWRSNPELRGRVLPFVLLTAFGIGTCVMVSMGRVWVNTNSVTPSMMDRYATYGLSALAGLTGWGWLMRQEPAFRRIWPGGGGGWRLAGIVTAGVLAMNWAYGCRLMSEWASARWRAQAGTMFLNVLPVPGLEDSDVSLKRWANQLNDHGFMHPALLKTTRLDQFKIRPMTPLPPPTTTSARNRVTHLSWRKLPDGRLVLHTEGVARGSRERTADAILMTWRKTGDSPPFISGVHLPDGPPFWLYKASQVDWMYVHHRFGRVQDSFASFTWDAPIDQLPDGPVELQIWMLNVERMEVTPLAAPAMINVNKNIQPFGSIITEEIW